MPIAQACAGEMVLFDVPESPHKPLQRLLCWLEQQSGADQCNEGLKHNIELRILILGHLGAVFGFALLAEEILGEAQKPRIQRAQLPVALVTY